MVICTYSVRAESSVLWLRWNEAEPGNVMWVCFDGLVLGYTCSTDCGNVR